MNTYAMEKRRHMRLPVDVTYRLVIDSKEYRGRIDNISSSGAYLASIEPKLPLSDIPQQGVLDMKIEEGWVSAKCEIVYIGNAENRKFSQGVGVEIQW
jgi:hypothetical protein